VPFTVTVTALANGNIDKIFNMDVHFTSSDSAAALPIDYTFTATDAGSHTFTNGITLMTPGTQTITATATFAHSITGTASVTVQNVSEYTSAWNGGENYSPNRGHARSVAKMKMSYRSVAGQS
jgi:hypothetical protein